MTALSDQIVTPAADRRGRWSAPDGGPRTPGPCRAAISPPAPRWAAPAAPPAARRVPESVGPAATRRIPIQPPPVRRKGRQPASSRARGAAPRPASGGPAHAGRPLRPAGSPGSRCRHSRGEPRGSRSGRWTRAYSARLQSAASVSTRKKPRGQSARASANGTAQNRARPPAIPTSANGAIHPKTSGCTRKGSMIQKSVAEKKPAPAAQPTPNPERGPAAPSRSQKSTGIPRNNANGAETGGCASAVTPPAVAESPSRRHRERPATRRSRRCRRTMPPIRRRRRGRPRWPSAGFAGA